MLETVTRVLKLAGRPMQVREVHLAAQQLAGESVLLASVKAALAAGTADLPPRFRRVRHGVYELASSRP